MPTWPNQRTTDIGRSVNLRSGDRPIAHRPVLPKHHWHKRVTSVSAFESFIRVGRRSPERSRCVVLVSGPAGAGRTSLVDALWEHHAAGALMRWGDPSVGVRQRHLPDLARSVMRANFNGLGLPEGGQAGAYGPGEGYRRRALPPPAAGVCGGARWLRRRGEERGRPGVGGRTGNAAPPDDVSVAGEPAGAAAGRGRGPAPRSGGDDSRGAGQHDPRAATRPFRPASEGNRRTPHRGGGIGRGGRRIRSQQATPERGRVDAHDRDGRRHGGPSGPVRPGRQGAGLLGLRPAVAAGCRRVTDPRVDLTWCRLCGPRECWRDRRARQRHWGCSGDGRGRPAAWRDLDG